MLKYEKLVYEFRNSKVKWINPAHNDEWANSLFPKGGYFVEVGACDGIGGSSCYQLEKKGWKGVCVEPNTKPFKSLIKNRKAICKNYCLSDKNEETIFLECAGLSTTIDSFLEKRSHFQKLMKDGEVSIKKAVTLEELLEEVNAPKTIEFLAMDIEGNEFRVLKNFPFDKYKILAISLEGFECANFLKKKGYLKVDNPWCKIKYESYYVLDI